MFFHGFSCDCYVFHRLVRIIRTSMKGIRTVGTIVVKTRKSGSSSYTAQIVRKKGSVTVHRESKTFDKKREAEAWLRWREAELDRPGALDQVKLKSVNLASAIDTYLAARRDIGRTKAQCLTSIKSFPISSKECGKYPPPTYPSLRANWQKAAGSRRPWGTTYPISPQSFGTQGRYGVFR